MRVVIALDSPPEPVETTDDYKARVLIGQYAKAALQATRTEIVLSLLPLLDTAVAQPVAYMQVSDTPAGYRSAMQRAMVASLEAHGWAGSAQCEPIERFAFYARVRSAFAIVHTGELQPFANFILKKGVISEELLA